MSDESAFRSIAEHSPRQAVSTPSGSPAAKRRGSLSTGRAAGLLLLAAVTAGAPWYAERISYSITRGRSRALVDSARQELSAASLTPAVQSRLVAQSVRPSVVRIRSRAALSAPPGATAAPDARPDRRSREYRFSEGEGSGVVIDEEGYLVTNLHVVGADAGADMEVLLSDGRRRAARLIGVDADTDLALLKVNAGGLIPAAWGDSDQLAEGDWVWAVGSPFGLDQSVTFGIVSGKSRREKAGKPHQDFLQTDAAVNPGNSGGPLVNARGEVVGINTAIVGDAYQGVSFAVPSEIAKRVVRQLKENGRVERGWLGVQMQRPRAALPPDAASRGVVVLSVVPGSPAEAAGMESGDRIIGWGEASVATNNDLLFLVGREPIGAAVELRWVRGDDELIRRVEVGLRP